MSFQLERQMTSVVLSWLERQGLETKVEYGTPWGICDVVGARLHKGRVKRRLSLGQRDPIGPPVRIDLLQRIPELESGRAITFRRLERALAESMTPERLQRELNQLLRRRFVTSPRAGQLQRYNGWAPLHTRIVAIELKLARIQEGLSQAASHLAFADESLVALPYEAAKRLVKTDRADVFHEIGVGVLGVRKERCEVLLRPRSRRFPPNEVLQMHCAERFWRTTSASSSS